ncbi:MAG: hypothetical protein ACFFD1_00685 [Candidatus Thorarchaeota archaeon]
MAKARVVLNSCSTYEGHGRKFVRGAPQIITNDSEILYYKRQAEFSVTMLQEIKATPAKAKETPKPVKKVYTKSDLDAMTKTDLVRLGQSEQFNLDMESDMKKPDMVKALMATQSLGDEDRSEVEPEDEPELYPDDDEDDEDEDEVESDDD